MQGIRKFPHSCINDRINQRKKITKEAEILADEKLAEEKQLETTRNFLSLNLLSMEQIAQAQGLPVEKVREIARELEKA